MKKTILMLLIVLLAIANISKIYADDYSEAILKAKKNLKGISDLTDRTKVLKVRGDFERILQLKKNEWMVDYYLAYVDLLLSYSYMNMETGKNDNDNLKKYTESAINLLDKATVLKDDFAEAYILKMSAQGVRWMYEPDKMNDIIAKISEAKETAKKLETDNPRFYLVDGTAVYYTPEMFGGGVDKALPILEKSWDLFQTYKPKNETYPDWGKDQAAGTIAMCYIQKEKFDDAKKWIDKALEVNPDSGFIKNYVQKQYDEKVKK
jgi:tetratricopeptide (TPR) repeat protein